MSIDVKRLFRAHYTAPRGSWVDVELPERSYLAIDGSGDPNTSDDYVAAVSALFTTAYTIRAAFKKRGAEVFVVGPLEGLWWADDPTTFVTRDKAAWHWTMLIPLLDVVTEADCAAGIEAAQEKKPDLPIANVSHRRITEGHSLQTLHVGSYDNEGPILAHLHHEIMPENNLTFNGPHHEIYLSDPRRVEPAKLKTILRQPVAPA